MGNAPPNIGNNKHGQRPFQFSLRAMLVTTALFCILFATFNWFGVSRFGSLLVTGILLVSVAAGLSLVAAMVRSLADDSRREE
jgi:hypothetical protein